jgi:HAD superfamily hydrolase (TIGR01509 family)
MGEPGVLLDLDGTLVDTNHLHALAWWRAFRRFDLTFPMQRIHDLIGMGGDKLVPELVGHDLDGASDAWSEEFHRLFDEVTLLPGARTLVQSLHDAGLTVVLASSSPTEDLDQFRELLHVDAWIDGATSSDDAEESKPDAEIFEVAIARFHLDPASTIAIGDTVWDAKAARRAGVGFIGVKTGGAHPDELRREGAIEVYDDAAAVAEALAGHGADPSWADGLS